ncbi:B-cell receptor CD22-like [Engraulis encrasicolus]|uniref:B-cell receptor CD22-like n=1 Tax=Engraulis encrasicolus TaxID=184585 RepID=UPI002FCEE7F8
MSFGKGSSVLRTALFCLLSGFLVELTVASITNGKCIDLQVKVDPENVNKGSRVTLTCDSGSCSLSSNPTYIWYKNSQPVTNKHTATESVCALEGSSVELHSYYSHPDGHTVDKTFWFIDGNYIDLKENDHYKDRVTYTPNTNNHTLSIKNLKSDDTREYRFRFITKQQGGWNGINVQLTVTGLQMVVNPPTVNEGSRVTLTCNTTCSLSSNPTYIWYRNSQPVTNKYTATGNILTINSATPGDAGRYSCVVEGYENLVSPENTLTVEYPPKTSSVSVYPPGAVSEGDSVTMNCSSDANPPAENYTWYVNRHGSVSVSGQGRIYNITNVTADDGGAYYCSSENKHGTINSSMTRLDVLYSPRHITIIHPSDLQDSTTLTCSSDANPPPHQYTWYRQIDDDGSTVLQDSGMTLTLEAGQSGFYSCGAWNVLGSRNSTRVLVFVAAVCDNSGNTNVLQSLCSPPPPGDSRPSIRFAGSPG